MTTILIFLAGFSPWMARACESGLDDGLVVSFDDASRARAGFERIGDSRFWWRDTFVLEDLGSGRGRVWKSYFDECSVIEFSPRLSLRLESVNGHDFHAICARIGRGRWARRYVAVIEREMGASSTVRRESELDLSKFALDRPGLASQLAGAGFAREGDGDRVWAGTFHKNGRAVRLLGLVNARDEALVIKPATISRIEAPLRENLRLGPDEGRDPEVLTLGNDRVRFELRDTGYVTGVVWIADLARIPADDPIFARPSPSPEPRAPRDEIPGLRALAEPFAKLSMLHARQLLGDSVKFGDVTLEIQRGDMRSLHTSRFDAFKVNTGVMRIKHPRTKKTIVLDYLAAYEAFAHGWAGDGSTRLDPRELAAFWED